MMDKKIKELEAKIQELEARITQLERKNLVFGPSSYTTNITTDTSTTSFIVRYPWTTT
jgi:BMFP domain-containing protein YqiC